MIKNIIIGVLAAIVIGRMDFWKYSNWFDMFAVYAGVCGIATTAMVAIDEFVEEYRRINRPFDDLGKGK